MNVGWRVQPHASTSLRDSSRIASSRNGRDAAVFIFSHFHDAKYRRQVKLETRENRAQRALPPPKGRKIHVSSQCVRRGAGEGGARRALCTFKDFTCIASTPYPPPPPPPLVESPSVVTLYARARRCCTLHRTAAFRGAFPHGGGSAFIAA